MSDTLTVADVLEGAVADIEKRGWTQNHWQDDLTGCVCAEGAITHAAGLRTYTMVPSSPAGIFFKNFIGEYISIWNDTPGRTQAEVVAKLREAAALARGEQP